MHVGVHCNGIVIVAPPSDIAVSLVPGAGEPGNGTAAIGIIEALCLTLPICVPARCPTGTLAGIQSHRGAPQAALSRACGPTGGPIAKRMKNQLCRIRRCYIALRRARWLGTSGIVRLPRVRSARGSLPRRE